MFGCNIYIPLHGYIGAFGIMKGKGISRVALSQKVQEIDISGGDQFVFVTRICVWMLMERQQETYSKRCICQSTSSTCLDGAHLQQGCNKTLLMNLFMSSTWGERHWWLVYRIGKHCEVFAILTRISLPGFSGIVIEETRMDVKSEVSLYL